MRVLAIPGSLRAASSTAALVRGIAALSAHVEAFGGLGTLPLFSPDLDGDAVPSAVAHLRSRVEAADAVLICTPEYAFGMPGALKNGLDWLVSSGSLYRRPVAALSASPSDRGGDRALASLRQTLTALDATVPDAAAFAVPFVHQTLDGDRIADDALEARVRRALGALREAA